MCWRKKSSCPQVDFLFFIEDASIFMLFQVKIKLFRLVLALVSQHFQDKFFPGKFIKFSVTMSQGGRSWQPFSEGKNGHKNSRQSRICYFRDKCVVFARYHKFANLTPYNVQHIPCDSALHAQEALFLTPNKHFFRTRISKNFVNHKKLNITTK